MCRGDEQVCKGSSGVRLFVEQLRANPALHRGVLRRVSGAASFRSSISAPGTASKKAKKLQKAPKERRSRPFEAGRSYVYNVARHLQLDSVGNGLDADGVKLYCGQMGKNVADRAIQVHLKLASSVGCRRLNDIEHGRFIRIINMFPFVGAQVMGGYGYVGEYNVERLWRDAKLLEIGGGTNEVG